MKIAISSKGPDRTSNVDPRFGRAPYILIFDTESDECEILDNSLNANAFKGAGIQAATMICDRGVDVLLTGYCGPKAFHVLEAAKVKVVNDINGTVSDAIETFNSGGVTYASAANAEAHW